MCARPGYSRHCTSGLAMTSSGSRKVMNTKRLFERVTANSYTASCHLVQLTHRLYSSLISMTAHSHTLTTLLYATLTTYSSPRQTRRSMRSMCAKCWRDSGNSASIAELRTVNSECRKSASCSLISLPMESAWNRSGSPQSRTGRHRSHIETFRFSSGSRTSTEGSSENAASWPFHWRNYERNHRHIAARTRKARPDGNRLRKPSWRSGNWKGPSPRHRSSSILIRPNQSSSKWMQLDSRLRAVSTSTMRSGNSGQSISNCRSGFQQNSIMTLLIGSNCPSSKYLHRGVITSRAPFTRFEFGTTTRTSNTSRHPTYSPEDKPGGWKFFWLTTLSWAPGRQQEPCWWPIQTTRLRDWPETACRTTIGNRLSGTIRQSHASNYRGAGSRRFGCRRVGEAFQPANESCHW